MSLVAGTRLGPYEIQSAIGAGGMGEVYKARDTRLDRTVAIKVLPTELSADPDRRTRFEREAKSIAGLTHPHICSLFDVGEHEGAAFLVMEHLQGETLAARLAKGPLPLQQALTVAAEIADALAAAHRQHIIHRDLKPGNVMLTKAGAKLLDFGLAKLAAHGERPAVAGGASVLTVATPITAEGTIVGTVPYMAPEQLEGKEADARTDLWALGAVLYEMLTGMRAFAGTSPASVISAVMSSQPAPLSSLRPMTPPTLDRVVKRCLEKDPDARWQGASDLAAALSWITEPDAVGTAVSAARTSRRRGVLVGLAAATMLLGVFAAWGWLRPHAVSEAPQVLHLPLSVRDPPRAINRWGAAFALSRDGTKVAYRTERGWQLLDLAAGTSRGITAEWQGNHAVFSPRGDALLVRQGGWNGQLVTVSLSTDAARLQLPSVTGGEMQWADDGWTYFGRQFGIARMREKDGAVEALLAPDLTRDNWLACNPAALPGGGAVIFTRRHRPFADHSRDEICVLDLGSKAVRPLAKGQQAWYLPVGYLLWVQPGGSVFAAPFDASRSAMTGAAIKVLDGVTTLGTMYGASVLKVADNGTLLYSRGALSQDDELVVTDRKGAVQRAITGWGGSIQAAAVSMDGNRLVASVYRDGGPPNLWMQDLTMRRAVRISYGEILDYNPQFLPDGVGIAYVSPRNGRNWDLYVTSPGGRGEERLLLDRPGDISASSFAARGWVVFCEMAPDGQADILAHRIGTDTTVTIAATPASETMPAASPDARWVAYQSDVSGRNEIYVRPLLAAGREQQVSTAGGREPWWSPSGRELFYVNGRSELMSVRVDSTGSPVGQTESALFPLGDLTWARMVRAGDRGFVLHRKTTEAPGELILIRNWFEELKAKVPAGEAK